MPHSAENFHRGEPFSVSLVSAIEKVCVRGGEYQDLPSKVICLTVSKTFCRGNPLVFIKIGYRKSLDKRGRGSIKIFRRTFFASQCRKFP